MKSMFRKFIVSVVRTSVEEALAEPLRSLQEGQLRMQEAILSVAIRLDQTNGRIDELGGRLDRRIDELGGQLNARIDQLDRKIDDIGSRLNGRIDQLDGKIDRIASRLDARIDGVCSRMDELSSRMDELCSRMDELASGQLRLGESVAGLRRDGDMTREILNRLGRLEERVFARAE